MIEKMSLAEKCEYSVFMENQIFPECFKENCAAWDTEKQKCKKFN